VKNKKKLVKNLVKNERKTFKDSFVEILSLQEQRWYYTNNTEN